MSETKTKGIATVKSAALFEEAKKLFPGGVNSPVRAFKSVGGSPIFMKKGKGALVWDEDDNEYIDFCCSWGPLIHGHADDEINEAIINVVKNGTSFGTPTLAENLLGKLIADNHRFIEKIRFVSSGTEATMSAIRLARGYTGRNKIIKFEGCYHGHADALLVKAGSGLVTLGTSTSAGVPKAYAEETIVLPLNDEFAVREAFELFKNEIACIIIEPIPANNGLLIQGKEFLQFLRTICTENGTLLFFDEVISGFRVGFEGAAGLYDIQPDLMAFGKIIGGGLPVGAYAGSAEIMSCVSPDGPVYQAGTLSGNPAAMMAGYTALKKLLKQGVYNKLEELTAKLVDQVLVYAKSKGYVFNMYHQGSIFWFAFSEKVRIRKASEIDPDSMAYFSILHKTLLDSGIYLGPSGYEVGFVSTAHSETHINRAIEAFKTALDNAFES